MTRKSWQKRPDAPKRRTGRWLQARNARIKLRDLYTCRACGMVTETLEIDHIVGMANGGSDDDGNLQALCVPCHERKTIMDNGGRPRAQIGLDGYPVNGWPA